MHQAKLWVICLPCMNHPFRFCVNKKEVAWFCYKLSVRFKLCIKPLDLQSCPIQINGHISDKNHCSLFHHNECFNELWWWGGVMVMSIFENKTEKSFRLQFCTIIASAIVLWLTGDAFTDCLVTSATLLCMLQINKGQ